MTSFSQFNIDIFLVNIFKNDPPGFFIEAGANDGISQNNTYLLEKTLNWNGLLVEPNNYAYSACKKNRNCIVENYALVSFDFSDESIFGDFGRPDFAGSMMGGCSEIHNKNTEAKAIQLSKLLDKHKISKIDFLSVDVEGYELEALSGINYDRHSPAYILYEDHKHRNVKYSKNFNDFFAEKKYKEIKKFSDNHYLYQLKG